MISAIISITVFIISIIAHELAHGYVAYRLGDSTAKLAGRLTLNPLAHLDPVGTVVLPVLLIITRSPVIFGWAKPVPVNPNNFANPRGGMLFTALAGPGANFILAAVFALFFKMGMFPAHSVPWTFLLLGVLINLILGIFNLIPIPPLDGANILFSILPRTVAHHFVWLQRYGFIVLIALLYLGLFDKVIFPLVGALTRVLIG